MSCQKSHMSCGDERPCSRCVDRGIAHTCCDGERKPRPHPGGGSSSSPHSAPKRIKHDDNKSHPRKTGSASASSASRAHSALHQQHLQHAASVAMHPHQLGMAVLPFAPVPSGPPSAMNPYASYYWQGTQNAPPTLEYHLTQELHHQQVAPHPHQHQMTLDHHHHAESLYGRPPTMHSAPPYLMPQKLTSASSYLTPTDAAAFSATATASTSTANTPDDSSSTGGTGTTTTTSADGANAAAGSSASTKDAPLGLPSAGTTGLEHYDYYGGYAATAYGLPSAVVSGRYWDAANPALAMDYPGASPQSLYSMDFSYHQQMHHRPTGTPPGAATVTSTGAAGATPQPSAASSSAAAAAAAAAAYYAMPTRPPTYGATGGSIQSQLI